MNIANIVPFSWDRAEARGGFQFCLYIGPDASSRWSVKGANIDDPHPASKANKGQ